VDAPKGKIDKLRCLMSSRNVSAKENSSCVELQPFEATRLLREAVPPCVSWSGVCK